MRDVQARADECSRYSNTLLVSLNNRIYFRDHPFRGSEDNSQCHATSGLSFHPTVTPIAFVQTGLRHNTSSIRDSLVLDTASDKESIDVEKAAVVGDDPNPRLVLLSQHFGRAHQRL